MKKRKAIVLSWALVLLLGGGLAQASEGHGGKGMSGGGMSQMMARMQARHQMMSEMMAMMKEMMGILKNLDHHPSAEEKTRLGKMMQRMDEMLAQHDEMFAEMQQRMQEMHKQGEDKMHDKGEMKGKHMM